MLYPKDLPPIIKDIIKGIKPAHNRPSTIPSDAVLERILEVCYHASFQTEEKRRLGFRVIFAEKKDLNRDSVFPVNSYHKIVFSEPRPFSISEILRLSPALEMTQVLICVSQKTKNNPELVIWGLLDTGSSWWKFIFSESSSGMPPPKYLTISSSEPGTLSISAQGEILITLINGEILEPSWDTIQSGPLGEFFDTGSTSFYEQVASELGGKYDVSDQDEQYPKRFYFSFFDRLLFHIRQKGHGGTVFFVPDYLSHNDSRLLDRINIKYPIDYDEMWNLMIKSVINHKHYYDLYFPMWDGKKLTKNNFQKICFLSMEREDIDEALSDGVRFISSLSGVDGAVLITDKFRVLGFGSEVTASSPSLEFVTTQTNKRIPINSFGTRHRSAFRFCSSFEESVGFIVSSDGAVRATMRVGAQVVLWPDINKGGFGI